MKQFSPFSSYLLGLFCFFVVPAMAQQAKNTVPNDNKEYRDLLLKNAAYMGISKVDAAQAIITDGYKDDLTGLTFLYVQQAYQGIRVFNTIVSSAFKSDNFQTASGTYVQDLAGKISTIIPALSPVAAVRAAASHLKLNSQAAFTTVADNFASGKSYKISAGGIARRDIDATLVFVPSEDKKSVKLAWNVSIDVAGSSDWWNVRIDAMTGEYLEKDNWTVNETLNKPQVEGLTPMPDFVPALPSSAPLAEGRTALLAPPNVTTAQYKVIPYPFESPIYSSFQTVTNPWELAGAGNNATTNGWHFNGVNNYTFTRGNNVFAFLDRDNNNTASATNNWPDTSTTPAPSLSFIHDQNPAIKPTLSVENKKVALDNLFYWNNIVHDVTYQYGFTEASGNFQDDNLARGGTGNDHVDAHAQDGNGTSNANFNTPVDGTSGRMQMYVFPSKGVLTVNTPSAIAGVYPSYEGNFVAPNYLEDIGPVTGQVTLYDSASATHYACAAPLDPSKVAGKIVLIDVLGCGTNYIGKVKNAQNAGAIGVLAYYSTVFSVTGTDATVTIPQLNISTATANTMLAQINAGIPVVVTLASVGITKDGDLDNGIVVHEYGHGVSNRLTGGPANSSCLQNAEQGGEGWSDYLALMLTTNWAATPVTAGPTPRPVGNYAISQTTTGAGIRRYPYSTNMAVNPLTYSSFSLSTEVHDIGEIWCAALWDMTWNIIQQTNSISPDIYNSSAVAGNNIALKLVMTGMKLQPCSPGFLDARDAILSADSILYNGAYRCAIWNAFSRRGMGFSARQGLSSSATDQTAAFDLPVKVRISIPSVLQVAPSTQRTFTHTLSCDCGPVTDYVVRDTIPAGFIYVSSTPAGATLSGNVLTFPAASFTASEVKNYTITLQTPAAGCPVLLSINDNRDGSTTGGFVSGGTSGWSTSTVRANSPVSSWFSATPTTITSNTLTSAATAGSAVGNLSLLSFSHFYNTESTFDGGVVEYSTNGGGIWTDAAPLFLRGSYSTAMDASTTLSGRRAFSGTNKFFSNAMLDLSSLGSADVNIRFRSTSDNGVAVEGWYVDDITRTSGCGALLKTGIYNASNVITDTTFTPVFITSNPLPLRLISFDAKENSGHVALTWKTAAEVNVRDFDVQWSADNISWSRIATVKALNQLNNNYTALHADPVFGKNYYRLKINDQDGYTSLSDVRIVNFSKVTKKSPVLVPNPAVTEATLYISKYAKNTAVKVYDGKGSLVASLTAQPGIQQLKINTSNLSAGIYVVEVMGEERTTIRMMVQK
ncbi:M36 family metallopeptidase [Ferruginibacter sp. HRS2-29]|uniref:M36 family metallopeptidase n=1 Tax=Ferruginibacter sp. HRS2-29 TaxID=2487334 RepID=UPI0020CF75A4|nr:M36 family metallopeptidase [Ferruginibacter sp. HRS2-29]MCP9753139.1 T9SS C-terminal target domain-containing protein [Ferruginibacter sp. HRS2-29]